MYVSTHALNLQIDTPHGEVIGSINPYQLRMVSQIITTREENKNSLFIITVSPSVFLVVVVLWLHKQRVLTYVYIILNLQQPLTGKNVWS